MGVNIGGSAPQGNKPASSGGTSFLKQGAAAKTLFEEEQAKAEAQAEARNKLWRFRIGGDSLGKDFKITFLDGHLDEDGTLAAPMWMEHTVYLAGGWKNVPCTSHEEPCPICAMPSSKDNSNMATLVAGFTVIDHTPFTIKKGPNAGKVVKDQRRLYIAKKTTFAILQKLASKNGGLVGCTFEVSRQKDTDPNVGNLFQLDAKHKMSELVAAYGDEATPADFGEEIIYYNAQQLISLGVKGSASGMIGGTGNSADLDSELGLG